MTYIQIAMNMGKEFSLIGLRYDGVNVKKLWRMAEKVSALHCAELVTSLLKGDQKMAAEACV